MKTLTARGALRGELTVPGDKSISHRALMLGAVAHGRTTVDGLLTGDDCLSTLSCLKKLGVHAVLDGTHAQIEGMGGLQTSLQGEAAALYTGNSGTTTRLLAGLLAGQPVHVKIWGDASIARRPMGRIVEPLRAMGADIETAHGLLCPLVIRGKTLAGIDYRLPVASAQLKSAILLAGLYADGETVVRENVVSRDHTERMLHAMGADIRTAPGETRIRKSKLSALHIDVPGDISSAAYFIVAAAIVPGSHIRIENVGINPTRTGLLDVLHAMGADITLENVRDAWEPVADIIVRHSPLRGVRIGGALIPRLIDELPVLAVAAACAAGETVICDASELRHKETDRVKTVADILRSCGAQVRETEDGMVITGGAALHGGAFDSAGDHRIAMSAAVAALAAAPGDTSVIQGAADVSVSYPAFFDTLEALLP